MILDAYSDITGVPTPFNQIKSAAGDSVDADRDLPRRHAGDAAAGLAAASRFLDAFGRAERVQTCSCERTADASVDQALHLNNGARSTTSSATRTRSSRSGSRRDRPMPRSWTASFLRPSAGSRPPRRRKKFLAILAEAAKDGAVPAGGGRRLRLGGPDRPRVPVQPLTAEHRPDEPGRP